MRALFVHDHIFHNVNSTIYSPGGLPSSVWVRYLVNASELNVIARGIRGDNCENLVLSDRENVTFDLFYNVKGGLDYYRHKKDIVGKLQRHILNSDIVILRVPSTLSYFASKICRKHKKPYYVEVSGCAWGNTWNYGNWLIKVLAPLRYFQMKRIVKGSKGAIYVTRRFLQKRYPTAQGSITSYASNVELPLFKDVVLQQHLELLNKDHKPLKLGLIGNLEMKYKGFDVVLKALKYALKNDSGLNFQLHLVGGGNSDYVEELVKKLEFTEFVTFEGRLSAGEDVFSFLDTLDLYLQPSKIEGLPRAVIEAMGRGCPVLASNVGGIPELIEDKYLCKPGNYKQLGKQLSEILNNRTERMKMAEINFGKAKDYTKQKLDERRALFWNKAFQNLKT